LDVFFPKFCVKCQKEGSYLCFDCFLFISEASFICPECEKQQLFGKRHKSCPKKQKLDGIVSLWDYEGVIKNLLHELKYNSLLSVLDELLECGLYTIQENKERFSCFLEFLFEEETVITFVPLEKKKEISRGFNQAQEIARKLGKITKKGHLCLLQKKRESLSQTGLSREERAENVKDVFSVSLKEKKMPQKVVVVDDVWTSGATLRECARVLKENGAKEVWGFMLAKVA
jgi:competence protein ComFC